ncbi:hypothetical protein RSOLAG1IB_12096 [Rhizoctonia solani AG-1 IB]|uniref:Uncharacterized protein n=1 Tax=Thanatephorus cucumeris (strain AG1-IB / isolate 7/3/14) TaxID=1108050 RepID=A0A0B7FGU3_THACB|nr:hypothetical protein RSOLAG1IB_12096 [Rhizoctonia solani AG-1 IB]
MLFVFTPWELPIYTISLRRLRASHFPPHVPVRAPRSRDESDPFLPFFYESHPRTPCRRFRITHAPVFLLGHADAWHTTGCWPPTRARSVAQPRRHPSSAYRLSCPPPHHPPVPVVLHCRSYIFTPHPRPEVKLVFYRMICCLECSSR